MYAAPFPHPAAHSFNQSIIILLIQLIHQPILIVRPPTPTTSPAIPRQLIIPPPPRQESCARARQDDENVAKHREDGGPDGVVGELAPAALVLDGALVGDAAEEVDS